MLQKCGKESHVPRGAADTVARQFGGIEDHGPERGLGTGPRPGEEAAAVVAWLGAGGHRLHSDCTIAWATAGWQLVLVLVSADPPPQLSRLGVAADWGFEGGRRLEGQRAMAWPRPTAPSARCSVPPTAACLETASVPGAIGVGVSQCERHFGFELGFAFQNRGWRPCEALSASEEISPASNRAALSAFMFSISEVAAFPPLGE